MLSDWLATTASVSPGNFGRWSLLSGSFGPVENLTDTRTVLEQKRRL